MREIKFRVWSNELKKYRFLVDVNYNQGLGMYFEVANGWGGNTTTVYHSVGDVPEQYTGLKDKNGKEIYEGDIDLNVSKIYSRIVWKKGGFWITWSGREKPLEAFLTPEMDNMMNIVGNVHQNAYLLEV